MITIFDCWKFQTEENRFFSSDNFNFRLQTLRVWGAGLLPNPTVDMELRTRAVTGPHPIYPPTRVSKLQTRLLVIAGGGSSKVHHQVANRGVSSHYTTVPFHLGAAISRLLPAPHSRGLPSCWVEMGWHTDPQHHQSIPCIRTPILKGAGQSGTPTTTPCPMVVRVISAGNQTTPQAHLGPHQATQQCKTTGWLSTLLQQYRRTHIPCRIAVTPSPGHLCLDQFNKKATCEISPGLQSKWDSQLD